MLAAILFFPIPVKAVSARNAILMDADTKRVLYEKNADSRSLIASTTKIMTALVICEQTNVLDRVRIPREAVGIEGSSMYLKEGEVLTVQELLYGLMLQSGNDAAVALAIYCAGTVEEFVCLMNDKAHRLGLTNTHFENPHGLDGNAHYSTARDMAVLAAYAMENPVFYRTVSAKNARVGERQLRNHNKLLWHLQGADGVKTGYTRAAGRILVSSVTRQGRRLIAVTMQAPNDWNDHKLLHESAFRDYRTVQVVTAGDCLGYVEVLSGTVSRVGLVATEDFYCPVAEKETVTIVLQPPGFVYAPVVEGAEAGVAYVLVDGSPVGKVGLSYDVTAEELAEEKVSFWQRIFGGKKS